MTNGKCIYHRAVVVQISDLKDDVADLKTIDNAQWTHINQIKSELRDMPKTKTLIGIAGVVVLVLVGLFTVVWAKVDKATEATYRLEAKLERVIGGR